MKHIGGHTWQATEPTTIQIGKPAIPPSAAALKDIRTAISKTGVHLAYWFWVSAKGDLPHLGLAISPNDPGLSDHVAEAVASIWKLYSPDNLKCDVFCLGETAIDAVILREGELLFRSPHNA